MTTDIIVLDDEPIVAETLGSILEGYGYSCSVQTSAKAAITLAKISRPRLFITDLKMPEMTGLEVLEEIKALDTRIPVVVVTGYGTIQDAVTAMKIGAFDFIAKPYNIDHIAKVVSRALSSTKSLRLDPTASMEQSRRRFLACFRQQLTPEMRLRVDMAALGPDRFAPVAIIGEPATGKTTVAEIIHALSMRSTHPYLSMDCSRLSGEEQEATLFGRSDEGSPQGLLDIAAGGSVLIQLIESASPRFLERLEHLLRYGEFRLNDGTERPSTTRILMTCASRPGSDASDCLPRSIRSILTKQVIVTPPLRKRKEALIPFTEFFVRECRTRYGRENLEITPETTHALSRHGWPGNLHELETVIERAVILAQGPALTPDTLPLELQSLAEGAPGLSTVGKTLKMMQTDQVREVITRHGGNREKAAAELGISVRTLYRKIRRNPAKQARNTAE